MLSCGRGRPRDERGVLREEEEDEAFGGDEGVGGVPADEAVFVTERGGIAKRRRRWGT